tara:strand:+ start:217 stop:897 length:681 start_codon:yes stop_codon:yes gene_type:complete
MFNPFFFIKSTDPYEKKSRSKNARFNGKQFTTKPLKKSCGLPGSVPGTVLNNNLFSAYDGYSKKPDPYRSQVKYIETQPPDKRNKGFGSGDAFKTDEFTNVIRTETYREQLKREKKITDARFFEKSKSNVTNDTKIQDEEDDLTDNTLFSSTHSTKPELYGQARLKALRSRERNVGFHRLASRDYGMLCDDKKIIFSAKAKFGSIDCTAQFFDKGHLGVGRNDDLM